MISPIKWQYVLYFVVPYKTILFHNVNQASHFEFHKINVFETNDMTLTFIYYSVTE